MCGKNHLKENDQNKMKDTDRTHTSADGENQWVGERGRIGKELNDERELREISKGLSWRNANRCGEKMEMMR